MVVAQIIEIQIGLHLDNRLLYPDEPCESPGHRRISEAPRPRAAISALFRLLDLPHIYNRNRGHILHVEGSGEEAWVKKSEKEKGRIPCLSQQW